MIYLFESKPCLWNIHDPSYAKRDEKELAYSSVAEQFEITIQAIKAKLNGLRTKFGREMSKCLKVRANRTTNKSEMLDENIGRFAPGLITFKQIFDIPLLNKLFVPFLNLLISLIELKTSLCTSNHMFKREIWDKFQKINKVNFPQISRINM